LALLRWAWGWSHFEELWLNLGWGLLIGSAGFFWCGGGALPVAWTKISGCLSPLAAAALLERLSGVLQLGVAPGICSRFKDHGGCCCLRVF